MFRAHRRVHPSTLGSRVIKKKKKKVPKLLEPHTRNSGVDPDSGLGFQVKHSHPFKISPLREGAVLTPMRRPLCPLAVLLLLDYSRA